MREHFHVKLLNERPCPLLHKLEGHPVASYARPRLFAPLAIAPLLRIIVWRWSIQHFPKSINGPDKNDPHDQRADQGGTDPV
jgi:hypothetical protein